VDGPGSVRIRIVFVAPSTFERPDTSTIVAPGKPGCSVRKASPARRISSTLSACGTRKDVTSLRIVNFRRVSSVGVKATTGIVEGFFATSRAVRPDTV
jgi:hypothetical protein